MNGCNLIVMFRCDGNRHCQDHSDEEGCEMIQLPRNYTYSPDMPPSKPKREGEEVVFPPVDVKTTVTVQNIISLDEESSTIMLKFSVQYEWLDHHLSYNFLHKDHRDNAHKNLKDKIWTPSIHLAMRKDQRSIEINTIYTIKKLGKANVVGGMDLLTSNETYSGADNPIMLYSVYQGDFICTFLGIDRYPFDIEHCSVEFYISGHNNKLARLIPSKITDIGPFTVGQYDVVRWRLEETEGLSAGKKGLKMTVDLGRNIVSIIMVTFLPTVLMNLVNQATNYTQDNFDLVITVNITCMMVLASIYISVSNSLPVTAAMKNIEIWLIFNLAYPVMVILVNIVLQVIYILKRTKLFLFYRMPSATKQRNVRS